MVKTIIGANGVIQQAGSGLEFQTSLSCSANASTTGLTPYPLQANTLTANTTLTAAHCGVLYLSSSTGGAKTITMPAVASAVGSMYVMRCTSNDAHVITGSASDSTKKGATAFSGGEIFTDGTSVGQKVTLAALTGSAVSMISDGYNWHILCSSGTLTFA